MPDCADTLPSRVLLTSIAGKSAWLDAVSGAARRLDPVWEVLAGDTDSRAPARWSAPDFWLMPKLPDDQGFPASLLEQCLEKRIRLIWPSRDGELTFWSRHAPAFREAGIEVAVSSPQVIQLCLDKLVWHDFCISRGLTTVPASSDWSTFGSGEYLVVKERFGAGSRRAGLRLDAGAAREWARQVKDPLFQPWIEGTEYSVDAWLSKSGQLAGLVVRERERVHHGEAVVTRTLRQGCIEDSAKAVFSALGELGARGPMVMQGILSRDGKWYLLEVNARWGGASSASIAAGLDLAYWTLAEAAGQSSLPVFQRTPDEVRQVRLSHDLILRLPPGTETPVTT